MKPSWYFFKVRPMTASCFPIVQPASGPDAFNAEKYPITNRSLWLQVCYIFKQRITDVIHIGRREWRKAGMKDISSRNEHEITSTSSSLRQRPALSCAEGAISKQVDTPFPLREKAGMRGDVTSWFYSPLPQPSPAGEWSWRSCNPLFLPGIKVMQMPIGRGREETMPRLFRERSQAFSLFFGKGFC